MTQTGTAAGFGNVIVQIKGDGNSVVAGLPHLVLSRRLGLNRSVQTDPDTGRPREIDLIRPHTRSIGLVGRDKELGDLREWLGKERPVAVRVLIGGAGYGKTRLALELVEEMAAQGWRAGFLTHEELNRFRGQQNLEEWGWNAPTLAILDYASNSVRDLHVWLKELTSNAIWDAAATENKYPLRILLLERQAERGSGWWVEVFGRGNDAAVLERLADPLDPIVLWPLDDANQRRAILTKTLACLGSTVTVPEPGDDRDFDRRLVDLTWGGVPLLLMIAAITADREGFGQVLALGAEDLVSQIAETELARIVKVMESRGQPLAQMVEHVTAVVTLRQGLAADAALTMIQEESEQLGYELHNGPAAFRDALVVALPDGEGGIAAVEPDMVGEAMLLKVWRQDNQRVLPAISRAYKVDPDGVSQTVIRTCQDYVIRGHGEAMKWLESIRSQITDLSALVDFSNRLPFDTVMLRDIAIEVSTEIVARVKSRELVLRDLDHRVFLGQVLNNHSIRLSRLGRNDEALAAIEEAVAIRRELVVTDPEAYRAELAVALSNWSNRLSVLGRNEEAAAAIEEAVAIGRELVVADPEAFRPDLALYLHNVSYCFAALDRHEEALTAVREAVTIRRALVAAHPEAFRWLLATSLNNLSSRLSDLGRMQEALSAIREAVSIFRDLAAALPEAFRPDLAKSLTNLSDRLSDVDQVEEALVAIEEVVGLYRELASTRPEAFRLDLAGALNKLSMRLSALGRHEEALAAMEEAVGRYREMASEKPEVHGSDLAGVLGNYSKRLSILGRMEEALQALREAVAIGRNLVATHPEAFQYDLARLRQ